MATVTAGWLRLYCQMATLTAGWLQLYCQMATLTTGWLQLYCPMATVTAGWLWLYCQMATVTDGWLQLYCQMATLTAGSQFCLLFLHHDIVILVDWALKKNKFLPSSSLSVSVCLSVSLVFYPFMDFFFRHCVHSFFL